MTPDRIECYYKVAVNMNFILTQFITGNCLSLMSRNFFREKKHTWMIGLTYFFVSMGLYYMPPVISNLAAYTLSIFAAFLVMLCVDRINIKMKVFLAVTFFAIRWLAVSMTDKIITFLSLAFINILRRNVDIPTQMMWKNEFIAFCVECFLDCVLNGIVLLIVITVISKVFVYKHSEMEVRELGMLLIPSISSMVCYEILQLYNQAFEYEVGKTIFNSYQGIQILWIVNHLVMITTIISVIILYQNLKQKQEEERNRFILENQINDIQSHIAEVEQIYSEVRGVKHDIKNHVNVLQSLLEQENYEEVHRYLKPLHEVVDIFDFQVKTGNPVTDVIINEKAKEARLKKIRFEADFHYPKETKINAFDVSVILNNALGNSIEAAEENGFININSFRNKNTYLITVSNSFQGKLMLEEESNLPMTSKEDKKTHGFGMKNMKMIASKYYGDIEIEQNDKQVKLTIMLMLV